MRSKAEPLERGVGQSFGARASWSISFESSSAQIFKSPSIKIQRGCSNEWSDRRTQGDEAEAVWNLLNDCAIAKLVQRFMVSGLRHCVVLVNPESFCSWNGLGKDGDVFEGEPLIQHYRSIAMATLRWQSFDRPSTLRAT
jgi:hypothetical protein